MAGEIGQAYVRIRPNVANFKSETEAGVKDAFSGVGRKLTEALGAAFALKTAFDFTKEIATSAADTQKSVEAIGAEFGKSASLITDWAEHGAAELGITAQAADKSAAQFGQLFRNLGIGGDQAAYMTLGLEKLVGNLASVRNIDPATLFAAIPSAIAGGTRSLKTLGIAVDSNTVKLAALRLGLIKTMKDALNPTIRAQAIYSLLLGTLPGLEAQAAAHSGDLADQIAKAGAEWKNAKDALGAQLLPTLAQFVGWIADKLPGGVAKANAAIHSLVSTIKSVTAPIGGFKNGILALLAAFGVAKIVKFAKEIEKGIAAKGLQELQLKAAKATIAQNELASSASTVTSRIGAYTGVTTRAASAVGSLNAAVSNAPPHLAALTETTDVAASAATRLVGGYTEAAAAVRSATGVIQSANASMVAGVELFAGSVDSLAGSFAAPVASADALAASTRAAASAVELLAPASAGALGAAESLTGAFTGATVPVDALAVSLDSVVAALGRIPAATTRAEGAVAGLVGASRTTTAAVDSLATIGAPTAAAVETFAAAVATAAGAAGDLGVTAATVYANVGLVLSAIEQLAAGTATTSTGLDVLTASTRASAGAFDLLAASAREATGAVEAANIAANNSAVNASKLGAVHTGAADEVKKAGRTLNESTGGVSPAVPARDLAGPAKSAAKDVEKLGTSTSRTASGFGQFTTRSKGATLSMRDMDAATRTVDQSTTRFSRALSGVASKVGSFGGSISGLPGRVAAYTGAVEPAAKHTTRLGAAFGGIGGKISNATKSMTGAHGAATKLGGSLSGLGGKASGFGGKIASSAAVGGSAMKGLGVATRIGTTVAETAIGGFTAFFAGAMALVKSLLISTFFGAIFVGIGIAISELITHWGAVKAFFADWLPKLEGIFAATWVAIQEGAKAVAYYVLLYWTIAIRGLLSMASHLPTLFGVGGDSAKSALNGINDALNRLKPDFSKVEKKYHEVAQKASGAFVKGFVSGKRGQQLSEALAGDSAAASAAAIATATKAVDKQRAALVKLTATQETTLRNAREEIGNLQATIKQEIEQEARDVFDAVNQAKSNLQSIMGTVASDIGALIDAPLNKIQNRLNVRTNKLALEGLRHSILLSGGKMLSEDPKKALAELQTELKNAPASYKPVIESVIAQYQQAVLNLQGAKGTVKKEQVAVEFGNLASAVNHGKLTGAAFKKGVEQILKKNGVNFQKMGGTLGDAFVDAFQGALKGSFLQANAIEVSPKVKGVGAGDIPSITEPLRVMQTDTTQIRKDQKDLANKQIDYQTKSLQYARAAAKARKRLADDIEAANKLVLAAATPPAVVPGSVVK